MTFEASYFGQTRTPSTDWRCTRRTGRLDLNRVGEPELRCARSAPPAATVVMPVMDTDEQDAERWDGLA